jgi:phage baseplate assembly protein W
MLTTHTTFPFPFAVTGGGRITATGGDAAVRGQVIQLLFTAPGERVHQPTFGCGLFNLVFEPNSNVLTAAAEFSIGQALARWLGDELIVDAVDVEAQEEVVVVQVAYTRRQDLARQAVRIQFK